MWALSRSINLSLCFVALVPSDLHEEVVTIRTRLRSVFFVFSRSVPFTFLVLFLSSSSPLIYLFIYKYIIYTVWAGFLWGHHMCHVGIEASRPLARQTGSGSFGGTHAAYLVPHGIVGECESNRLWMKAERCWILFQHLLLQSSASP